MMAAVFVLSCVAGAVVGFVLYALQSYKYRMRKRNMAPKSFLDKAARWRAVQFKKYKSKCRNYSPDNSKVGVSCIFPWCDYCSFYCPRRDCNG